MVPAVRAHSSPQTAAIVNLHLLLGTLEHALALEAALRFRCSKVILELLVAVRVDIRINKRTSLVDIHLVELRLL